MNQFLGHLVRRLHQQSTAIFSEEMAKAGYDVTPMQFAALKGVSHHKDIDQASLADYVACDRATMCGVIDRLERKGLLQRKVSPNDRRARILSITQAGEALLNELLPLVTKLQNQIGGGLDDTQRKTLESLLVKALTASQAD